MFNFLRRSKIPINQTTNGGHGDHWGAMFGFECDDLEAKVVAMATAAVEQRVVRGYRRLEFTEPPFVAMGIGAQGTLATIYPTLRVDETIPVTLKEIIEWKHVDGIEAQVCGGGRDTFGLNFFATDYLENRAIYRKGGTVDVALSAMAYVIKETSDLPDDFADDFCSYMPNSELTTGHSYDFIGDVVSVESMTVCDEPMIVTRVKLINVEENPDMFVLPMLANPKNMQVELEVGGKVSGCFGLMGAIATKEV